jgi:hypothetical protein
VGSYPTGQSPAGVGPAISEIRNPFEWNGGTRYRRGLLDGQRQPVARPSLPPAAPPKTPPAYLPEPGMEGLPPLPGTEGMPGYEGAGAGAGAGAFAPGAGGEGLGAPGMAPPGMAGAAAPGAGGAVGPLAGDEGIGLGGGLAALQEVTPVMIGDASPFRLISPALAQSFQRGNDGTPVPRTRPTRGRASYSTPPCGCSRSRRTCRPGRRIACSSI